MSDTPRPKEYELALAILLLAAAAVLISRSRAQTERVRIAAMQERTRRIEAEDDVQRHTRNMDGALGTIKELNDRLERLEHAGAGARPAAGRPAAAKPAAARRPAGAGS